LTTPGSSPAVPPVGIGSTVTPSSAAATTAASTTEAPIDAPRLAGAITAAERGIRDGTLPAEATARWGRAEQRAFRLLAAAPGLDGAVRALLPADVLTPFDANVAARRAVVEHAAAHAANTTSTTAAGTATTLPPPATLPAWTIVAPLPVDVLLGYYHEAEQATGVPWQYLAAINLVETRMGRIVGASSAGALGPMQFLPTTWRRCCTGDIMNAHDAIIGAAVYLRSRGAPSDMAKAVYAYNPNSGYVGAVQAYALNITNDPRAYVGYHAWEVYSATPTGAVRLPVGYRQATPADLDAYLAAHPGDIAPLPLDGS